MDEQAQRHPRDDELMEDNIIGIYLSTDLWCDSNPAREDNKPKLRRFVHDQESIQQPRLIGKGLHGVVILASIGGVEYALKIVSHARPIAALQLIWSSSRNGSKSARSSSRISAPYTSHRLRANAELLHDWTHGTKMEHGLPGVTDG